MSDKLLPAQGQPVQREILGQGRLLLEVESLASASIQSTNKMFCCFLPEDQAV